MKDFTNADRWRHNLPADDAPRIGPWAVVAAILAALALAAGAGMAHGADTTPAVVVFTMPGCSPCQSLKSAEADGQLAGFRVVYADRTSPLYAEFARSVADTWQDLDPAYIGPVPKRPQAGILVPAVWVRGSAHYWSGFTVGDLPRLRLYLEQTIHQVARQPDPSPVTNTTIPQRPRDAAPREPFDGVHVAVLIPTLTSRSAELRADLARRADLALQELVRSNLGDKARAYLVAEVADPDRFNRLTAATGIRPGPGGPPVACHVLIPERFRGLQGWMVGQVQASLGEHFLTPLQNAGVSVILERIHGGTYEAVLQALAERPDDSQGPRPPVEPVPFVVAAWLSERSDLARRLLARLGFA